MMKDKKKENKLLITVGVILTVVVVLLILVFAFADSVIANVKFSKIRREIKDCTEIVITAPLYKDSFSYGAEIVLTADEAEAFLSDFLNSTEDVSFDNMISGGAGFWDTHVKFYTDGEMYSVYLKEESIYITSVNGYLFEVEGDLYEKFYEQVTAMLAEHN